VGRQGERCARFSLGVWRGRAVFFLPPALLSPSASFLGERCFLEYGQMPPATCRQKQAVERPDRGPGKVGRGCWRRSRTQIGALRARNLDLGCARSPVPQACCWGKSGISILIVGRSAWPRRGGAVGPREIRRFLLQADYIYRTRSISIARASAMSVAALHYAAWLDAPASYRTPNKGKKAQQRHAAVLPRLQEAGRGARALTICYEPRCGRRLPIIQTLRDTERTGVKITSIEGNYFAGKTLALVFQ